jgi:Rieske Fe-S protein
VRWNGEGLVLVGGEDHRVGHGGSPLERYQALEQYARGRFRDVEVVQRWSGQVYEPADGLPYVGRSPLGERLYVATGYAGSGLVLGTLAAHVLADALRGRSVTPLAEAIRATRAPALAAAGRVTRQGLDTAVHYVVDRLGPGGAASLSEIEPESGAVVEVEGQKLAVYRDGSRRLHAFSPACTHMGCIVRWNAAERSWDCPCHGGRFAALGDALCGPPLRELESRALPRDAG